jgi:hypothetical protein
MKAQRTRIAIMTTGEEGTMAEQKNVAMGALDMKEKSHCSTREDAS